MANRMTRAIERVREKLATLTPEQRKALDKNMDLTFHEHFEYQQQQAQAHAAGRITTDEAQVAYIALGEIGSAKNGGWASGTDLAHKIVVTQMIGELLGAGHRRTRVVKARSLRPGDTDAFEVRGRRHDTGAEGPMHFGEGGVVRLTERSGRPRYRNR
jgi:hypothetical protein